jgi:hypothetical protein
MELLGDVGHVESRFGPFKDSVSAGARWVHGLRPKYDRLKNHFGCTRWYSWVTRPTWNFISVRLEIMLILMQDWFVSNINKLENHFRCTRWGS